MDENYIKQAIKSFLREDIGTGDITSEAIFAPDQLGEAVFIAKDDFMAAGMEKVAMAVFLTRNADMQCLTAAADGSMVKSGDIILRVKGAVLDLLKAERVALNLVQRLCGIATLTAQYVDTVRAVPVKIVDTRKTIPGLRVLEKYAVTVGGGHNHRFNLADGALIKDNHIAACGSIRKAVAKVRDRIPHTIKIEVECETIVQVEECLTAEVDIIMLDNMTNGLMKRAVNLIKDRAIVEASGGVNLDNVREIAGTGVDIISVGAITHSATACDISMRFV